MDSDDEHIEFVVQPYLYEPLAKDSQINDSLTSSDEDSASDRSFEEDTSERIGNTTWCTCALCVAFPTADESVCCQEFEELGSKLGEKTVDCITQHEGFIGNCLNPDVIEVSFYEFLQANGPIGDEEPIHEVYRYIAYRRLARWIWHRLRKHERRPLPACAVNAIRQRFPSKEYTGFKYARHDL